MAEIIPNGAGRAPTPEKLWEHADPESTPMWKFLQKLNAKYSLDLQTYEELHTWSCENLAEFWEEVWIETGVKASKSYEKVIDENAPMFPRPKWFQGARLNFAENLLYPSTNPSDSTPAIIEATETSRATVKWAELRDRVRDCQAGMMAIGVKENDRVAGLVANHTNALVAMLAATSLGAIWTAVSPDTGVYAVVERMQQIEPVALFTDNASFYNGKAHPILSKVAELAAALPSLAAVVVFQTVSSASSDLSAVRENCKQALLYDEFTALCTWQPELKFAQLDPDHPVYILYSSGTTGAPKCIVHGAIGTLIQHKKEHVLHCGITPSSRLFYFTTCTWMMWHWLVSGLASGCTLILYDGSPFRYQSPNDSSSVADNLAMPRLIDELQITHFGTSAKYLSVLEQKSLLPMKPPHNLSLSTLQAIYSTGSLLAPSTFRYVYAAFPPSLTLASITGGTDIVSLFACGNPLMPIHAGEIQAPGLGMSIRAYEPSSTDPRRGEDITSSGAEGDLVCTRPFPCQPVAFWGPTGAAKYESSYFAVFDVPGPVWHHGDYIRFNPATRDGIVMLGRSDGVLKPQGVRFGSAEIYNVVLKHFGGEVGDAVCVGRRREGEMDETVVLFVKMEAERAFTPELVARIKTTIRKELSARHVPGIIDECLEIPMTSNGKKVETAVKQILSGKKVKTGASVSNAECLEWYKQWAETH